jgi:hypothetical protein
MSDRVTISNLGLGACGCTDKIVNPDDDGKAAREIRSVWDEARLATLRAMKPSFAIRRGAQPALADIAADAIYPFPYAYALPAEALRLCDLLDHPHARDYRFEGGRVIATIPPPLRMSWIVDVPDCSLWDASFVEAFAQYLGFKAADNLTGDRARKLDCWNAWKALTSYAKAIDAVQNPPIEHAESSWIEARWQS